MMVFFAVQGKGWSRSFSCWRHFNKMSGLAAAGCNARSCYSRGAWLPLYWGGIRLNLGAFFKWTSLLFSSSPQGWQLVPFAHFMKPVVEPFSGNRLRYERGALNSLLFGTLMEGIFGYQEAPSVSESPSGLFISSRRWWHLFCHHGRGDCVPLRVANTTQTLA